MYRAFAKYFPDRIMDKLRGVLHANATIIEAPSGYGKTTVVKEFLNNNLHRDTSVHWFTALPEMPSMSYKRLCRVFDKIDDKLGSALFKIGELNEFTLGDVCDLIRTIRSQSDTYLIIDDFQYIDFDHTFLFFSALLEHGCENLHIIIITQMLKRDMLCFVKSKGIFHVTTSDLRFREEDIRHYFNLSGVNISKKDLQSIAYYTDGWIIAVCFQLCAYIDKGYVAKGLDIMDLMEELIWNNLSEEQQVFLLTLSYFKIVSLQQIYALSGFNTLLEYEKEALLNPFIRYNETEKQYEFHELFLEILTEKRKSYGEAFEHKCLAAAGNYYLSIGKPDEAFPYFWKAKDFDLMLSLDLSSLALKAIDGRPFWEIAPYIANNCPLDIKKANIFQMLQIAWALLLGDHINDFKMLMSELKGFLENNDTSNIKYLKAEWKLLFSFTYYPKLKEMTEILKEAEILFEGKNSRVILPDAPWNFCNYCPLSIFHLVSSEADKEADAMDDYIALYSKLTNGHGSGADALFRSELSFYRGDLDKAEAYAYKAVYIAQSNRQSIVFLGATLHLAEIALERADSTGWQNAMNSMGNITSFDSPNTSLIYYVIDIIRGVLLNELKQLEKVSDWLKEDDYTSYGLLPGMIPNVDFVKLNYLMHKGMHTKIIGISEILNIEELRGRPFSYMLVAFVLAKCHLAIGERDKAITYIESACEISIKDGFLFPVASYSFELSGLVDETIRCRHPEVLKKFNMIKERYILGWAALHEKLSKDDLPSTLTRREYEIAVLAASGLHNNEIAKKLMISETTVRTHLRNVFQKLLIDRRSKLAEKLK